MTGMHVAALLIAVVCGCADGKIGDGASGEPRGDGASSEPRGAGASGAAGNGGNGSRAGGVADDRGTSGGASGTTQDGGDASDDTDPTHDADISDGSSGPQTPAGDARAVRLELSAMTDYVGSLLQVIVVADDGSLLARTTLDPLGGPELSVAFPVGVDARASRLDVWADFNGNRVQDALPGDHTWSFELPAGTDEAVLALDPSRELQPLDELRAGMDFSYSAEDMEPVVGRRFELRVVRTDRDELVGWYTLGVLDAPSFSFTLAGILTPGVSYRVDSFADTSDNLHYDPPPVDSAWRQSIDATDQPFTIGFSYSDEFTDIGFE